MGLENNCIFFKLFLVITVIGAIKANIIVQDPAQKPSFPPTTLLGQLSSNPTINKNEPENAVLGAACAVDANCSTVVDATCDRGMCNCGPNFTVAGTMPDRCLRVVKLGEACEEDVQCAKGAVGGVCVGFHCVCSDLYTEESGRCVPKRKLGSPCKLKDDCAQMPFADCNVEGVCACPKPLIPSKNSDKCLIMASPAGEPPCQEDIQCTTTYGDKSKCVENVCSCYPGYHSYNGKCLPDLKLGDTCNQSFDCLVSKHTEEPNLRMCSNATCICTPTFSSQVGENQCSKGYGYQLQASLAWLLLIFLVPYLF